LGKKKFLPHLLGGGREGKSEWGEKGKKIRGNEFGRFRWGSDVEKENRKTEEWGVTRTTLKVSIPIPKGGFRDTSKKKGAEIKEGWKTKKSVSRKKRIPKSIRKKKSVSRTRKGFSVREGGGGLKKGKGKKRVCEEKRSNLPRGGEPNKVWKKKECRIWGEKNGGERKKVLRWGRKGCPITKGENKKTFRSAVRKRRRGSSGRGLVWVGGRKGKVSIPRGDQGVGRVTGKIKDTLGKKRGKRVR